MQVCSRPLRASAHPASSTSRLGLERTPAYMPPRRMPATPLQPRMGMDKCPPEIHARIFAYACTDDGTTGCALALVSRYIRQVSAPYQWQALALTHYTCVLRFARLIARSTHQDPARPIHHLFLSDRRPPAPLDLDRYTQYDTEFVPALATVLRHAARTLVTLSFFSDACFVDGALAVRQTLSHGPFPCLAELTLRACCTPSQLAGTRRGDSVPCDAPRLTRLHLALPYHGFSSGNLQATHNLVRSIAPAALTHLRFTMLDKWGSRRVVEVVHAELAAAGIVPRVLALPPSDWDAPHEATARAVAWDGLLPRGLARFALQPSPTSTFYCSCCMDLRGDVDVMRVLECIAECADARRFAYMHRRPIRVRRCRTDPMEVAGYGFAEARADWLERADEGDGCWVQREEMEEEVEEAERAGHGVPADADAARFKPEGRATRGARLRGMFRKLKVW